MYPLVCTAELPSGGCVPCAASSRASPARSSSPGAASRIPFPSFHGLLCGVRAWQWFEDRYWKSACAGSARGIGRRASVVGVAVPPRQLACQYFTREKERCHLGVVTSMQKVHGLPLRTGLCKENSLLFLKGNRNYVMVASAAGCLTGSSKGKFDVHPAVYSECFIDVQLKNVHWICPPSVVETMLKSA